MIGFLVRLYPAAWRQRYGDEFEALLGERPLGPFDAADILLGALDAHLRLRRRVREAHPIPGGLSVSIRVGGLAAMAGGVMWVLAMLGLSGQLPIPFGLPLTVLATMAVLVALSGLSAFQARRHPVLIWTAFAVPAAGCLVSVLGLAGMVLLGDRQVLGDLTPWHVWAIGSLGVFGGSALFALVTWRTEVLSQPAAAVLGIGSFLMAGVIVGGYSGTMGPGNAPLMALSLLLFAGGWFGLGFTAMRRPSPIGEGLSG